MIRRAPAPHRSPQPSPRSAKTTTPKTIKFQRRAPLPRTYLPEYAEQARELCLLGLADPDLADFFDVDEQTLATWKTEHPEFRRAIKQGTITADAAVAYSLYCKAIGHSNQKPDTNAALIWLKNRRPDLWHDRTQHELTGADGGPIKVTRIESKIIDSGDYVIMSTPE